jgi:hypothetical protein
MALDFTNGDENLLDLPGDYVFAGGVGISPEYSYEPVQTALPDTSGTPVYSAPSIGGSWLPEIKTGVSDLFGIWRDVKSSQFALQSLEFQDKLAQKKITLSGNQAMNSIDHQISLEEMRAGAAQSAVNKKTALTNKIGPFTYEQWGLILSAGGLIYAITRKEKA